MVTAGTGGAPRRLQIWQHAGFSVEFSSRTLVMRRSLMVVLGLLAATTALTAVPKPASAQLPGILGEITRPLGALLGGPRHFGRRHYSRKASRSRAPVAAQTQPAAAAVAGGAAAAGGAA